MAKKNNQHELRNCFSKFATGVMIATTAHKKGFYGLTVNSFSSVSLDPALVLFSIGNDSYNLNFFKKSEKFCLNILNKSQLQLAQEFAKPTNIHKWEVEDFSLSKNKNPIFDNSAAFFDCKKYKTLKAGDHHIFIGEIVEFKKLENNDPLFYFEGKFS